MEEKRRKFPVVTVVIIVIGVVLLLAGLLAFVMSDRTYSFGRGELVEVNESYDAKEIEKFDFDLGIGSFTVKTADTDKITIEGKNVPEGMYKIGTSGDKLEIKTEDDKWYNNMFGFVGKNNSVGEFEIIVPAKEYDVMELDCGIGEFKLDGLKAEKFDLDGGIGEIDMTDCEFGKSNIDAGIGEINFSGKFNDNTEISMGIGEANFNIDGLRDDYEIKKDGSVKIEYDKDGSDKTDKTKIDIETGIGEISLRFK